MTTLDKIKEPENIVIDFNKYPKTASIGLEHFDTRVKAIVENLNVEVKELSKGIEEIFTNMKKDLEQGRIVVTQMLKGLNIDPSSSIVSTINFVMPQPSATTPTKEPNSSTSFLKKEKEMLELKANLLSKKNYNYPSYKVSIL